MDYVLSTGKESIFFIIFVKLIDSNAYRDSRGHKTGKFEFRLFVILSKNSSRKKKKGKNDAKSETFMIL